MEIRGPMVYTMRYEANLVFLSSMHKNKAYRFTRLSLPNPTFIGVNKKYRNKLFTQDL